MFLPSPACQPDGQTLLLSRLYTALKLHEVLDSCVLCRSLNQMPRSLLENTTQRTDTLGSEFAADVMERNSQRILVIREKLSQYTWLRLIPIQTAESLKSGIVQTILPWIRPTGATVRTDGPTGFVSLSETAKHSDSIFCKNKILFDIGRGHNRNKNPVAENVVCECEKEIIKHYPHVPILSSPFRQTNSFRRGSRQPKEIKRRSQLEGSRTFMLEIWFISKINRVSINLDKLSL